MSRAKEDLCQKEREADATLSEARTKAIAEFKSSEEFQQYLASQGQDAMIAMLSKVQAESQNLSPRFLVDQLDGFELLCLWEAMELAITLTIASILPLSLDDTATEPVF